jgi:tetrahydromethanopterin S-methyltransferase subunit G
MYVPEETNEILQRLTRVETKLDLMINARDIANEALQSTKAAHHRQDKFEEELKEIRSGQRWLIGTTISVVGLFITAVGFLWKLGGAG